MHFLVQIGGIGSEMLLDERPKPHILFRIRRNGTIARPGAESLGQERWKQYLAAGLKQRLFEDTLQLANVAWPGVSLQSIQRRRVDVGDFAAQFPAEAPQIMTD